MVVAASCIPSGRQISALNSSSGASFHTQIPFLSAYWLTWSNSKYLKKRPRHCWKKMRALGTGLPFSIQHADANGAAGLHLEVDRSHLRGDAQLLHVGGPALGGNHDSGRSRLATGQPVDSVSSRLRFADVVQELRANQGPDDRLSRLVSDFAGDRQAAIQNELGDRFPTAARCRTRRASTAGASAGSPGD